jgi:uncharacterized protein (TIGR00730 family)
MKITVFGGAKTLPGEFAYTEAYQLGKLLGEAGHTILTGGYSGTMEAVSHGASESGAHVIGVTCDEIEKWRPTDANTWVIEEWRKSTLTERMMTLITSCDTAIALPGGVGTFTEILVHWNQLLLGIITQPPLILIGDDWRQVIEIFGEKQNNYLRGNEWQFIKFAANVEEAYRLMEETNG